MKKFILPIALLATLPAFANLNTVNYQAVVKDANGALAVDKTVGLKFTILSGETTLYTEEGTTKTGANGLVEWQIGSKNEEGLADINWEAEDVTLEVGIDLNGGTNYSSVYTSTVQSVPAAFYSSNGAQALEEVRGVAPRVSMLEEAVGNLETTLNETLGEDAAAALEEVRNLAPRVVILEEDAANTLTTLNDLGDQVDLLNESAVSMNVRVSKVEEGLENIEKTVAEEIDPVLGELNEATTSLGSRMNMVEEDLKNLLTTVNDEVSENASQALEEVRAIGPRVAALEYAEENNLKTFEELGQQVDELNAAAVSTGVNLGKVQEGLENLEKTVSEDIDPVLNEVRDAATSLGLRMDKAEEGLTNLETTVRDEVSVNAESALEEVRALAPRFETANENLENLETTVNGLGDRLDVLDEFQVSANTRLNTVEEGLQNLEKTVSDEIDPVLGEVRDATTSLGSRMNMVEETADNNLTSLNKLSDDFDSLNDYVKYLKETNDALTKRIEALEAKVEALEAK